MSGNPVGRPPLYSSPDELQTLVDEYFENTDKVTLAGLADHIGISRKSLYNYEDKDDFLHIIKKAREKVERHYEELTIYGDKPTGVIFALKNMGWKDRIDQTTDDKPLQKENITVQIVNATTEEDN